MSVYQVRNSLKNTIAGKEQYLADLISNRDYESNVIASFLQVNIKELKAILKDVEACCEEATETSWALNPDRMGR